MKKFKKFIFPPIFSIGFIAYFMASGSIINATPVEGYGGIGLFILILFVWLIIALPIYCIIYSKIIVNEKLKFVFSAYNSLLIIVLHLLPLNNLQHHLTMVTHFVLWVLFWNMVPLCIRLSSIKRQAKMDEELL